MKENFANTVRRMIAKPGEILAKDEHSTTYVIFSGLHLRYVALKIYRRDFLADEEMLRKFRERAASLHTSHLPGLAYPLEFGAAESRFYQVTELLPGASLARFVDQAGPLSPEAAIRFGRMLLRSVRQLVQDHEIKPVLTPQRVQIWPRVEGDWFAGVADYDPRPPRNPFATPERTAVEQLMALVRYARFGERPPSHELSVQNPTWFSEPSEAPSTFDELEAWFDSFPRAFIDDAELPVRHLPVEPLSWFPESVGLPDCYAYHAEGFASGLPTAYAATDLFRGGARWVHVLPPESATGPTLEPYLRQGTAMAQGQVIEGFLPVDSVMRDPRCRLVAEKAISGMSLAELPNRRGRLSSMELICVLRKVSDTVGRLRQAGWVVPPLEMRDVVLTPVGPGTGETFFGDLTDGTTFEIKVRAIPSNLLGRDLPDLSQLEGRTGAAASFFLPENSFVALAYCLVTRCHREQPMPAHVAACFNSALLSRLPNSSPVRDLFLARLSRAIAENRRDAPLKSAAPARRPVLWTTCPEETGIRLAVGVSAALVMAACGYIALHRPEMPGTLSGLPENQPAAQVASVAASPVTEPAESLDLNRAKVILQARKTDALLADLSRLREGWTAGDPTQGLFAAALAFIENGSPTPDTPAELRAIPISFSSARADRFIAGQKRDLAAKGNVEAMMWMGDYLGASLTATDHTEAARFYTEAAKSGSAEAMYRLAESHFRGRGVSRNPSLAVMWLERSHKAGNPRATDVLATCYAVGASVEKDHSRAAQLYREAIRRGNRDSLGNLGFLYLTGEGVTPDQIQAYDLFRQGAQEEALWSMVISALCLEHGVGTAQNSTEARVLFVKAARMGHPGAIRWCNVNGLSI